MLSTDDFDPEELKQLEDKVNELTCTGQSERERLMLKIIDKKISTHRNDPQFSEWSETTVKQLFDILKEEKLV